MRHLGILSLVLALSSIGHGRTAALLTEFYVDPDYGGSVQNGQPATPWSALGGGSGPAWAAVNQALSSGDVTIYFSARQAGSDTNDSMSGEMYLYRTSTSSYRLTLDGMSRYNTNDVAPSWASYGGSSRFQITGGYPISTYEITAPQSYVTIRGFRVISTGGQLLQYGRGGSHVVIENNEFSAASSATIGAGVGFGDAPGTTDLTIRNNVIHDSFGEAIYIGGNSYTVGSPTNLDGVLIENNHIYNAGRWGGEGDCIDIKAGIANVTVRNNLCHDNVGTTNVNGITSLSPLTAEGNVVYNIPGGKGITFGASGVIVKNLIYNANSCGIYACDDVGKPVHTSITDNTVYNCGSGLCLGNFSTASSFQAINNLITNCPGGGMGGWLPSSGNGTFTIRYNDVFANGGTDYGYPEKYFIDGTDLSVDPLYVNAADPAGADGKYFTADDGFALRAGSPVATAGEGGTCIGALPVAGSGGGGASPDTTPPSVPTNLAAHAVSTSQISLSWTASTDNVGVTGYLVFRDGTQVAATAAPGYTDSGLSPSSSHSYTVAARDAAGNGSGSSAPASATTFSNPTDTTGPAVAIVSPTDGQTVSGKISVGVTATDPSGVQRVELYVNGSLRNTLFSAPWSFTLNTKHSRGRTLTLTAKAFDAHGNASSDSINVTVR